LGVKYYASNKKDKKRKIRILKVGEQRSRKNKINFKQKKNEYFGGRSLQ